MFDQYNEGTNYMTYDSSSLNKYNKKNCRMYSMFINNIVISRVKSILLHNQMNHHNHETPATSWAHVMLDQLYMMVLMVYMATIQ